MYQSSTKETIDYLIIGHITQDITPTGIVLGGTATYAALTAKAIGLRVGMITACPPELSLNELDGIAIQIIPSENITTFQNKYYRGQRTQYITNIATKLDAASVIPECWRSTPIVHIGPVAQEISPNLVQLFPHSFIGITPQGWLRGWDHLGKVYPSEWFESNFVLEKANAVVLSIEDVDRDEKRIDELLSSIRILVVTEGKAGARLFWNGDLRYFRPPEVQEIDPTGAGDIFATAFFIRLYQTHDPWEATRFATQLAASSVTRYGIEGIPTAKEVQHNLMEIVEDFS